MHTESYDMCDTGPFTPGFKYTKDLKKNGKKVECKQNLSIVVLISPTYDIWYPLFVWYALSVTPCNARHGKTGNAMPSTIPKYIHFPSLP